MFFRRARAAGVLLAAFVIASSAACSAGPDLATSLKVVPTLTGYYDDSPAPDGQNRLLPSITFQLENLSDQPISNVDLVLLFWPEGRDAELDSKQIRGIGSTALEPHATSESITVRSSLGYTSPHARAEFFTHSQFVDLKIRFFAKKRGRNIPLGEVMVERRLLPHTGRDGSRP
jgi:hypothetical protein